MNVRLQYDLEFLGGIYYQDLLQLNQYHVSLNLTTQTKNPADTNIAMDRLKCFVLGELESTVFINQSLQERGELMSMMGINITILPEEPVDQIIGIMLCLKLNAIMEDRLVVTDVEIWSRAGDSMSYLHNWKESTGPLAQEGWWMDSRPIWTLNRINTVGKVVNLGRSPEWKSHDLDWDTAESDSSSTVVFAKFDNAKK